MSIRNSSNKGISWYPVCCSPRRKIIIQGYSRTYLWDPLSRTEYPELSSRLSLPLWTTYFLNGIQTSVETPGTENSLETCSGPSPPKLELTSSNASWRPSLRVFFSPELRRNVSLGSGHSSVALDILWSHRGLGTRSCCFHFGIFLEIDRQMILMITLVSYRDTFISCFLVNQLHDSCAIQLKIFYDDLYIFE